jgi:hypothetical protein
MIVPSSNESHSQRARAASVSEALNKAVAGGVSGGAAQGINVLALMWLRTTMNVQMVNGSSMRDAFKTLYAQVRFLNRQPREHYTNESLTRIQGGIPRFYRGLIPALIQSPISR